MRDRQDITETMRRHADTVMRVCSLYYPRPADRDDLFQDTFLRYAQSDREFESNEHRKAWLIRVAANACKDALRRKDAHHASVEELGEDRLPPTSGDEGHKAIEHIDVLQALHRIDEKYRVPLYLKYYEGRTAAEIAELLEIPENTVYTNVARQGRTEGGADTWMMTSGARTCRRPLTPRRQTTPSSNLCSPPSTR